LRFAVLADSHIGRSIPLAIADYRRNAFSNAFSKALDSIIKANVDYVFICGDLFERRTLRPYLVQFVHDELYRIAVDTNEQHGKLPQIFLIRGNHDGRPQSDTLDYLKHPLAEYLYVFEDEHEPYADENLSVVGLNYYDRIELAYKRIAKPALEKIEGLKILMIHGFVSSYNQVPPYSSSISLDQLAETKPDYVFTGHYHQRCKPRRLPNGGWIITPGSLEMYDFAESPVKGFYIIDHSEEPEFNWIPIEPMHIMRQENITAEKRRSPQWFNDKIKEKVNLFKSSLKKQEKPGYLRIRVRGRLKDGFLGEIDLTEVKSIIEKEPLLLWVDVDTIGVEMPILAGIIEREQIDIAEFFSQFGEFSQDIREMHGIIREILEESASVQTGLLTPSLRIPLINDWVQRFEAKKFRRE
jgi:DNA repair exonuclease SbcCD nuclease subunit